MGDKVLLRQTKNTVKPPFDPKAYVVEEVRGAEITARRGKKNVTRNVQKWKGIKERPRYLQQQSRGTGTQDDSDEEVEDWYFELPGQQEQEGQAGAGDHQPQEREQRQIPQERWEVALGPWRPKGNSPSPRERKRRKQAAKNRDKGQRDHLTSSGARG